MLQNSRGTSLSVLFVDNTCLERPLTLNALIILTVMELATLKILKCRKVTYSLQMKSRKAKLLVGKSIGSVAQPWEDREIKTKSKALEDLKWLSKSLKLMRSYCKTLTYSLWCVKYIRKAKTLKCLMTWLKLSKSMILKAADTTRRKTSSTQYSVSLNRLNQLILWNLC